MLLVSPVPPFNFFKSVVSTLLTCFNAFSLETFFLDITMKFMWLINNYLVISSLRKVSCRRFIELKEYQLNG